MFKEVTSLPTPTERLLRVCIWALLYALPLGVALLPLFDEDVWWHLRAGEWMLEHGRLPETDPFSRYGIESGKPWIAYSWLYEVLLAALHRGLGDAGIVLYRTPLTLAILLAFHRLLAKREPRFFVAAGVMGLADFAMLPLVKERPWLFTILFGILTLDVILDLRAGRRPLLAWLLPLLYAVWANLHIQFTYGLLLLGLACIAAVGERVWRPPEDEAASDHRSSSRPLALLTTACILATLLTPYHVGLYRVVLEYAGQQTPLKYVAEMQSPQFRDVYEWAVLALTCGGVYALARRRRLPVFETLFLVAAGWLSFRSRRDAWVMALATAAAVVSGGPATVPALRTFWPRRRQAWLVAGLVGSVCVYLWTTRITPDLMRRCQEQQFPVVAVEVIRQRGYAGPVYNSYNWGGYLMWKLPEMPVAIDGRANLHGEERFRQSMTTWLGNPRWDRDPALHEARLVIAESGSPLVSLLQLDPRFELAYRDQTAVLFIARQSAAGYTKR